MPLRGARQGKAASRPASATFDLILALAALTAALLVSRIATLDRPAMEAIYARGLYPAIATALASPARAAPFCLAAYVAAVLAIAAILWVVRGLRSGGFSRAGVRLFGVAAIVVWLFLLVWGLNHARPALLDRLGLPRVEPTTESLGRLAASLTAELERAQREAAAAGEIVWGDGEVEEDRAGRLAVPREKLAERLATGHRSFTPAAIGRVRFAKPKSSRFLDLVYTKVGIAGLYFPFTGEATYNGAMPDPAIPFAMAHEMAHQRGTAREDESNFLAFVACRKSGSPAARYSAALGAWRAAIAAYSSVAPDSALALTERLPKQARRDLRAIRAFWLRHAGPTADVAERVNDAYLKASGDRRGVQSYGRMIDLLLAYESATGDDRQRR